jgi:hypothetical protein
VALAAALALVIALIAGILAHANGATAPGAVLNGFGAFAVACSLALALLDTLERP